MTLLRTYLAERVRPLPFLPLIVGLWLGAVWASGATLFQATSIVVLPLIALLVLQFRLWDDLEDADRDRFIRPERLVVRGPRAPFWRLLAALSASTGLAAAGIGGIPPLAAVVVLDGLFLVAYRAVRPRVPDAVWRLPLLLSKYPAFVLIAVLALGAASAQRLVIAAAVAWLLVLSYEARHAPAPQAGVAE